MTNERIEERFKKEFGGQKWVYANEDTILDFLTTIDREARQDIYDKVALHTWGNPYKEKAEAEFFAYEQAITNMLQFLKTEPLQPNP